MDDLPRRRRLKHEIPPFVFLGGEHPAFFITICCAKRGLNQLAKPDIWELMHESILERQQRGVWFCTLFIAMPDHVHAIIRFQQETRMIPGIRDWKRWISRMAGIEWQRGFFDHRLRSQDSAAQKRLYILNNPVRAGLVEKAEDWKYVWNLNADK